jgi:hypothetical protein
MNIWKNSVLFVFMVISLFGCEKSEREQLLTKKINVIIEKSQTYALNDKLDNNFELVSATRYSSPRNNLSSLDISGAYSDKFNKLLNGKVYWIVCYSIKKPAVGAEYCYFIDDKSEKLLDTHRGR